MAEQILIGLKQILSETFLNVKYQSKIFYIDNFVSLWTIYLSNKLDYVSYFGVKGLSFKLKNLDSNMLEDSFLCDFLVFFCQLRLDFFVFVSLVFFVDVD